MEARRYQKLRAIQIRPLQHLHRIRTWFTLFFIPIIPYSAKRLVLCDKCRNEYDISQEHQEIKELRQRIQDAQDCT